MPEQFRCGRRGPWIPNSPLVYDQVEKGDNWREDGTCSYCGSLAGGVVLARLKEGTAEIGPTDKNYKAYIRNAGGEPFKQSYRTCGSDCQEGPDTCPHWVTRNTDDTKFYFQHLDEAQQGEFIDLYNAKAMKIGYPGHFYRTPYFCQPTTKG